MALAPDLMSERVAAVRDKLGVEVCSLYLAHRKDAILEMIASSGLDDRAIGARLTYSQGLTGKVARSRQPVVARDIQSHVEYFHVENSGEERFRSYLGIPLEQDGELHGVLVIQTEQTKTFFHRDIKELYSAGRDLMEALIQLAHGPGPARPV